VICIDAVFCLGWGLAGAPQTANLTTPIQHRYTAKGCGYHAKPVYMGQDLFADDTLALLERLR
jgi:hypothetical protein